MSISGLHTHGHKLVQSAVMNTTHTGIHHTHIPKKVSLSLYIDEYTYEYTYSNIYTHPYIYIYLWSV